MKICEFDTTKEVLVIAEIGNNHEGDYSLAEEMIGLAANSGADAVKFQTIVPERLISCADKDRIAQLERFQFSYEQFEKLRGVASREGVMFLSTPFDVESVGCLEGLVGAYKIASGDNNFCALLEAIARTGKGVIMSTGVAGLDQIGDAKKLIEGVWRDEGIEQEVALLHCVASYPVEPEEANLLAIRTLHERFGGTVGYSDHTLGIEAAVASVALGGRIVEKHFTIDKNYSDFHDHQLSADVEDFTCMVARIRQVEVMLGDGCKLPGKKQSETALKIRRSIAAARDIRMGSRITSEDITWLRPGGGMVPGSEGQVVGKILMRDMSKGEQFCVEQVS